MKKIHFIIIATFLLSACQPQELPTHEEVSRRRDNPTPQMLTDYCTSRGGRYEDWKNEDGTLSTYCILPQGYGCDPLQFFQGSCDVETLN